METDALRELLEKLVGEVQAGQDHNRQLLELLDKRVTVNREAIEGMNQLLTKHTQVINVMRDVLITLFEDRFGSLGGKLPEGLVN